MVFPLFLLLMLGVVEGAWFVLEVSAVTNSARTAARWEVVAANWDASGYPDCVTPGDSAPLVAPARTTAGPFASEISASAIVNTPVYQIVNGTATTTVIGCKVTIKVSYSPLQQLAHIGPSTISSSFTAYLNG
jgi:Flp pilus assembly protein TadG